jgi:cAMP phosphodiesterase
LIVIVIQLGMNSNMSVSEEIDQSLLKILKEDNRSFKETHTFEERFIEYQIIRCNYPGFLPVCCEL